MSKSYSRIYFEELLKENKNFLAGKTLNVGGGNKTYRQYCREMVSMDLFEKNHFGSALDLNVLANAEKNFSFKPSSFDSVLCTFFLQYVKEPKKVVENIKEVLKPGGHLILSVPFMDYYQPDPRDYWRFTHDGLKSLLEKDFKIIKFEPLGGRFLWFLRFLQLHKIPNIITKPLYPVAKKLSEKEKNAQKWSLGFFCVAKKN